MEEFGSRKRDVEQKLTGSSEEKMATLAVREFESDAITGKFHQATNSYSYNIWIAGLDFSPCGSFPFNFL